MNILYIAYSCCPNSGSEDAIGWNVPLEMSKSHNVYIITKEEHRSSIKKYIHYNHNPNLHFYFVDIPDIFKKIFKGFLYSGRLNIWHKRAFPIVRQICTDIKIDIIHQITPVEFRALGDYGRIKEVKFVAGPLGGGEYIPKGLKFYVKSHLFTELLRRIINEWYRWFYKCSGRFKRCDCLLFANAETQSYLQLKGDLLTEIAVDKSFVQNTETGNYNKTVFLWAGRMIYRKGLDFLFDAMEMLPINLPYVVRLVGEGPEKIKLMKRCKESEKLSKHVVFAGVLPYRCMREEYSKASVFIMPSLRETTGTVMLEAMSNGLPVIAINGFGSALMLNDKNGWLYNGNTKDEFIHALSDAMLECITNHSRVIQKGETVLWKISQYTWQQKANIYNCIYNKLM